MSDHMDVQLTDEEVNAWIKHFFDNLEKTRVWYNRGLVTDSELICKVASEISIAFYNCFNKKGFSFVMEKRQNWIRYKEEYSLWKQGMIASGKDGSAWLMFDRNEAAPEDKNQWFRMHDLLFLPIEFYMPIDAELDSSVSRPDTKQEVHTYASYIVYDLHFDCFNDGGLMKDDDPIGKEFVMINDKGLSANITVTGYEKNINGTISGIEGNGWIEGYTEHTSRKFEHIALRWDKQKHINSICYYESKEDYLAYLHFPLWQEYFRKEEERSKRRNEIYKNCIDKLNLKALPVARK